MDDLQHADIYFLFVDYLYPRDCVAMSNRRATLGAPEGGLWRGSSVRFSIGAFLVNASDKAGGFPWRLLQARETKTKVTE